MFCQGWFNTYGLCCFMGLFNLISLSKFNLPPFRYLYVTHAARTLQSHDLSEEEIKLWITYILFWPHKYKEGLLGWDISPMPGPPPRQNKHERQYTPSIIPTRRIWNEDYNGQMILVALGGLKFPDVCLTGEKTPPPKNLTQETCPDRASKPGPLRDKRACYNLLHRGGRDSLIKSKIFLQTPFSL